MVIDGYTLNPGDLSWDGVKTYGTITLYDRTSHNSVTERCKDANIILTNKVPISAETINAARDLKLICVTATGYNIVDVAEAMRKNIPVCNVPNYGTASVAQHTIALLLELSNRVGMNTLSVSAGVWQRCPDFCYSKGAITELQGKTLGIIGFGKIGQQTAKIAAALGMRVIYYSPTKKDNETASYVDLNTLLGESDVVSLHCPLTKSNNQFINRDLLSRLRPTAWLINTSRGQLINEQDLADALNNNSIGAAALDVLAMEPPSETNPLLKAKNCLITPHTAWMSLQARTRILSITVQNIENFLKGKPSNLVSV